MTTAAGAASAAFRQSSPSLAQLLLASVDRQIGGSKKLDWLSIKRTFANPVIHPSFPVRFRSLDHARMPKSVMQQQRRGNRAIRCPLKKAVAEACGYVPFLYEIVPVQPIHEFRSGGVNKDDLGCQARPTLSIRYFTPRSSEMNRTVLFKLSEAWILKVLTSPVKPPLGRLGLSKYCVNDTYAGSP